MIQPVRIGMVGLGGFGQFVLNAFAGTPEVQVVAVHDVDTQRAQAIAAERGLICCNSYEELAAHPEVEVVYLATPPAMHGPAILTALANGKHVFVEKPLATSTAEADQVAQLATAKGLRVGIDYVLRFNPVYRMAVALGHSGLLGELRHMTLENDAADEGLPPQHWFWNPQVSGTILVEHGVHFFDIAARLAGATGTYEYSQSWHRPVHGFQDRVLAVTRYGQVPATFYHAFDKPGRIERTEFRLAYDLGYITVKGWMPVDLEVDAVLDDAGIRRLQEITGGGAADMGAGRTAVTRTTLEVVEPYAGNARQTRGRGIEREVASRVRLRLDCPEGKQPVYARTIQAGIADFARGLRDASYVPEVTLEQAIGSLRLALTATEEAQQR